MIHASPAAERQGSLVELPDRATEARQHAWAEAIGSQERGRLQAVQAMPVQHLVQPVIDLLTGRGQARGEDTGGRWQCYGVSRKNASPTGQKASRGQTIRTSQRR